MTNEESIEFTKSLNEVDRKLVKGVVTKIDAVRVGFRMGWLLGKAYGVKTAVDRLTRVMTEDDD